LDTLYEICVYLNSFKGKKKKEPDFELKLRVNEKGFIIKLPGQISTHLQYIQAYKQSQDCIEAEISPHIKTK